MSEQLPNKVAYIFPKNNGLELTFKSVKDRATLLACNLLQIGFKKGDRIGFLMPNTYELLICYFAAGLIGLVVVPLDQDYGAAELQYMIEKTQPAGMVIWNTNEFKQTTEELFPNIDSFEKSKYESKEFVNLKHFIFINSANSGGGNSSKNAWSWDQIADQVNKTLLHLEYRI